MPEPDISPAGPFDRWPTGLGFEYFYGFNQGEAHQYYATLYRNTNLVAPPKTPEERYHLTEDMTDEAIAWINNVRAANRDKPWFTSSGHFGPLRKRNRVSNFFWMSSCCRARCHFFNNQQSASYRRVPPRLGLTGADTLVGFPGPPHSHHRYANHRSDDRYDDGDEEGTYCVKRKQGLDSKHGAFESMLGLNVSPRNRRGFRSPINKSHNSCE